MEPPSPAGEDPLLGLLGAEMLRLSTPQPPAALLPRGAGAAPVVQVLVPPEPWDWPAVATGRLPLQAVEWCERVPAAFAPGAFANGAARFSQAYADLMSILEDARTLAPFASRACKALAPPVGDPADAPAPPGWMRATDGAGILRWTPEWVVEPLPQAWRPWPGGASIDLTALGGAAPVLAPAAAPGAATGAALVAPRRIALTAAAWGRVTLAPGAWFDATPVELLRQGVTPPGFAATRAEGTPWLLGEGGILPGRVASLLVADAPVLEVELPAGDAGGLARGMDEAQGVHVGGFFFPTGPSLAEAAPTGATTLRLPARETGPYLVAAVVEAY